jgi:hypothetical protein
MLMQNCETKNLLRYNTATDEKPASKVPSPILATRSPPKLKAVDYEMIFSTYQYKIGQGITIRVEQRPQPIVADAIQTRGVNNFDKTVAGI